MSAAIAVGLLVAGGTYLVLQRSLLRMVLGFVLLGHAVNILLVAAGGMDRRGLPLLGQVEPDAAADPLPQAFVLTAIVITFAITVYLLGMLLAGAAPHPDDTTPDGDRDADDSDAGSDNDTDSDTDKDTDSDTDNDDPDRAEAPR